MAEDYGMPTKSRILLYQTEDGRQRIEVRLENETVWLSQRLLAELFQKDVRTINEHIKNIYDECELLPESTIRKFRIVQTEGNRQVSRTVDFYNLNVIIAVGYRVRSHRGTQFRKWATEHLREYIVKGFTVDGDRAPWLEKLDEKILNKSGSDPSNIVFWQNTASQQRQKIQELLHRELLYSGIISEDMSYSAPLLAVFGVEN